MDGKMIPADIIEPITKGLYSLLLGAGASANATSSDGRELPLGPSFGQELVDYFRIDADPTDELRYLWDVAVAKVGNEDELRRIITIPRFNGCKPQPYHLSFPEFPWKRIYSFNIDDVFENAYSANVNRVQNVVSMHYTDDFKDLDRYDNLCQLIHLHGSELFPSKPIVFGPDEYADTVTKSMVWWHVFSQLFFTEPIIVIGATLKESDFEYYYGQRRTIRRAGLPPSLYVSKKINAVGKAICDKYDLHPLEMSGEDFINELKAQVPLCKKPSEMEMDALRNIEILKKNIAPAQSLRIARSFVFMEDTAFWPKYDLSPESFYEGRSPEWCDIEHGLDIYTQTEQNIVELISKEITSPSFREPYFLLLESPPGEGKTGFAMRIGATLGKSGLNAIYYNSDEIFDTDCILALIKGRLDSEHLVIILDDADRHINQIRKLMIENWSHGARLILLGTTRTSRTKNIISSLSGFCNITQLTIAPLTLEESRDLARKLRNVAKLGTYAGKSDTELAGLFTQKSREKFKGHMFSILADIVPGSILSDRLQTTWTELPDDDFRRFVGVLAMSTAAGYPLRSSIALAASKIKDSTKIFTSIGVGHLKGIIHWKGESLYLGHRVVAEKLITSILTAEDIFKFSSSLAISVAPFINRDTIIKRTVENGIAKFLMDADGMVIPRLGQRGEDWFKEIQNGHEWNSRYWEQRALYAKGRGDFDRAIDYAEQAVAKERHPLPLTTCANIKLQAAALSTHLPTGRRKELFFDALNYLQSAIPMAKERRMVEIHPYMVLFKEAVNASKRIFGKYPPELIVQLQGNLDDARKRFGGDEVLRRAIDQLLAEGLS
jgi:hypothetical protein